MLMSRYENSRAHSPALNKNLPSDDNLPHYKVVFVGEGGAGKTNLLNRLAFNRFDPSETRTISHDVIHHRFSIGVRLLVLAFWDTAGQERQHSQIAMYYRNALICVAVFDCTNRHTFDRLDWWLEQFANTTSPAAQMDPPNLIIVSTKSDLVHLRQVTREEGETYAAARGALFAETNAVRGMNADELVIALGKAVVRVDEYASARDVDLGGKRVAEPEPAPDVLFPWNDAEGTSRIIRLQDPIPTLTTKGMAREDECMC